MSLFFSVSTSPNSTEIAKRMLNNNTSMSMCFISYDQKSSEKAVQEFKNKSERRKIYKKTSKLSEDLAGLCLCRATRAGALYFLLIAATKLGTLKTFARDNSTKFIHLKLT